MAKNDGGLSGMNYQLNFFALIALRAASLEDEKWELSTENGKAGKFDDVVFESGNGGNDILIQCKYNKKEKVLKWKNLLLDYYNSYKEVIIESFKPELLILCSNNGPSNGDFFDEDEELTKIAIFSEKIKSLKFKSSKIKELQKKLNASDDLSLEFCEKFRFFHIDDSAIKDDIEKELEDAQNTFGLKFSKHHFMDKMNEFLQEENRRIKKSHVVAFLYDSRSQDYLRRLDSFKINFKELYAFGGNAMINIVKKKYNFLNMLKVHRSLLMVRSPSNKHQPYKKQQLLFIDPSDGSEILNKIIVSFELPGYCILVISLNNSNEYRKIQSRIMDILNKQHFKKVIILSKDPIQMDVIEDDIKFTNLTEACQTTLLSKEVNFQGKDLPFVELINDSVNNIDSIIDQETIIKLINGENIKIGTAIRDVGEIEQYYMEREFELEKIQNISNSAGHNETFEVNEIRSQFREQVIFTENDVCNFVDQPGKFVLISGEVKMGKTTILTRLGYLIKEIYPSFFLIRVDLNKISSMLKEFKEASKQSIDLEEILQSKDMNYFKNSFEKNIFSNTKNIILMVDAFDEVSPTYTSLIKDFMLRTSERKNISKIFVTTCPNSLTKLVEFLKTCSYRLLPYSKQVQTDFLMKYWGKKLIIRDAGELNKCAIYAKKLISKLEDSIGYTSWNFIGIPLQTRMIAEIFQGSDDKKYEWTCCKDFLLSENENLKLPDEINITKLYDMFVERKREIFIGDKCNIRGNVGVQELFSEEYEVAQKEHQKLAARLLLEDHEYSLMNISKSVNNSSNETIIRMGMLQEIGDKLMFVHQTFSEYFLAKAMWAQLKELKKRNKFLLFLLNNVFINWKFEVIRAFFEGILTNEHSQIPKNVFKICGSTVDSITWRKSKNINRLAREGRKYILKLMLEKSQNSYDIFKNHTESKFKNFRSFFLRMSLRIRKQKKLLNIVDGATGKTVLSEALEFQEIVEFFLAKGANVNGRDKHGRTILHYAAEHCKIELVECLVKKGARINVADIDGLTPLHLSVIENSSQLVSYFIKKDVDVNTKATIMPNYRAQNQYYEIKARRTHPSIQEITPLHSAAYQGHLDCLKILVNRTDVKILVNRTDVNVRDKFGQTPLHWAAEQDHSDCLKPLLDRSGDVNIKNCYEKTPLHLAAKKGHFNCLKILVESKADVNIQDKNGDTPLHSTAEEGHLDCLKFLADARGDVNIHNNNGETPLHLAAENGHLNCLKILVESRGDINIQNKKAQSVLDSAKLSQRDEIVKYLLELIEVL